MSSSRKIYNRKKKRLNLFDKISRSYFLIAFSFMFFLLFFVLLALILSLFLHDYSNQMFLISITLILGGVILFFYVFFLDDKEETKQWRKEDNGSWGKGATGEEHVENLLRHLPDNYLVINDFQTNEKGNVDHIVIAPAGVFVIETKNTSGHYSAQNNELLRNGRSMKKDYLKQSFAQMKYWRGALKHRFQGKPFINVYGRLVLLNTRWVDDKAMALAKRYGLRICMNDYILKNLRDYGSKKYLKPEEQNKIYDFIQLMNKK